MYIVTVIRRTMSVSVPCNTCPGGSLAEDPSGYFDRCVPASAPQELPRGSRGSLAETNRPSGSVHTLPYHFCYPRRSRKKHSGHGGILAQRFHELMSPDRVLISFLIICTTMLKREGIPLPLTTCNRLRTVTSDQASKVYGNSSLSL